MGEAVRRMKAAGEGFKPRTAKHSVGMALPLIEATKGR